MPEPQPPKVAQLEREVTALRKRLVELERWFAPCAGEPKMPFILDMIVEAGGRALGQVRKELEQRVDDGRLRFCGIYSSDTRYRPGDAVSFHGSLFVAKTNTSAKPELGCTDWQIAVKRGRDGRDLLRDKESA